MLFRSSHLLQRGLQPNFGEPRKPYLLPRDRSADVPCNEQWPLVYASELGLLDFVRLLLAQPQVDPTWCEYKAVHTACRQGYASIVELFLKTIDTKNLSLTLPEHYDVVEVILKWRQERCNWDKVNDISSFYWECVDKGDTSLVKLCLHYTKFTNEKIGRAHV